MKFVKQFMNSDAYSSLLVEADTNEHALELLEIINLTIESLLFFLERDISTRAEMEQQNLYNLFQYIKETYEQ